MELSLGTLGAVPTVLLHDHRDGGPRPETAIDPATARLRADARPRHTERP
ncbi:MAG: hypothetical protein ACKOTZ_04880 [Chloroflexota bacterium]